MQETNLYAELLMRSLIGATSPHRYHRLDPRYYGSRKLLAYRVSCPIRGVLGRAGFEIVSRYDPPATEALEGGAVDTRNALTMIGAHGLRNVHECVETVLKENVPGDLIETGVWRGGTTIFMRGLLEAFGDKTRTVWVADSFRGLPTPNVKRYPLDRIDPRFPHPPLGVSADQVRDNFRRYGLLDDRVRFLEGWFGDTLPTAPIDQLAVLRLDGDLYESTMDALTALYPKLAVGGFLIVDDYGVIPAARQAVHDYRDRHGITETIVPVDHTITFWRRASP